MAIPFETIDKWADDLRGPVALHLRQKLLPVEGEAGVIFPPSYAMGDNRPGAPYAIDTLSDNTKVVQVDSVGSQSNRIEPLFMAAEDGSSENPLARLVPQVSFVVPGGNPVSLFEVGHRLGDAFVRASSLNDDAAAAFAAFLNSGDAGPIAKLAPTSLVFGVWDSRGDQAKLPRIVQSIIRAWNVDSLKRSAQYVPPVDYSKLDVFTKEEKEKAEGTGGKSPLAQQGFVHVPAVDTHGGVVARGPIYRDVTLNFVALRQLGSMERAKELRRYILGLALVAAAEPMDGYLRQGCLLVPDSDFVGTWTLVARSGKREDVSLDAEAALAYARRAAEAYGVGPDRTETFSKERAKADLPAKDAKKKS